jgi:hypothetical protein
MRAAILNGTLKRSPQTSNTDSLASNVAGALRDRGVDEVTQNRLVDHDVKPGVESDMELREGLDAPDRRRRAAHNLVAVARALRAHPIPKPPNA